MFDFTLGICCLSRDFPADSRRLPPTESQVTHAQSFFSSVCSRPYFNFCVRSFMSRTAVALRWAGFPMEQATELKSCKQILIYLLLYLMRTTNFGGSLVLDFQTIITSRANQEHSHTRLKAQFCFQFYVKAFFSISFNFHGFSFEVHAIESLHL